MSLIARLHGGVYDRRIRKLRDHLAPLVPRGARVLDVGGGDGLLGHSIARERPDVEWRGLDVLLRGRTHIPMDLFDGRTIPHGDASFDAVVLVDVVHHAEDPLALLREAVRVTRSALIIKDHTRDGFLAGPTLRFMDWIGNARHGVALPYNYWPRRRWLEVFEALGLEVETWTADLRLYPNPAGAVFGRSLHFLARLVRRDAVGLAGEVARHDYSPGGAHGRH
jgi:SAM-dependent methyltransferase